MSIPVIDRIPAVTTARFSAYKRSTLPSSTCSKGIAAAVAITDRTLNGDNASKPYAAAGAYVRT